MKRFILILGCLLGALVHTGLFLLAAPYAVSRFREGGRHTNVILRAGRVVACLPRAFVLLVSLLYGSIRYGRLVL